MKSETIVIGPRSLSDAEVKRANEKLADQWKGYRLMALIPLVLMVISIKFFIGPPTILTLVAVLGPQGILFLAMLTMKPYREIRRITCTFTLTEESITLESRLDRRRPGRLVVQWQDIVGLEDAGDAIVLYLKSGDAPRLFKECFTDGSQSELLIDQVRRSRAEVGLPTFPFG